jgi:hypothetical protein
MTLEGHTLEFQGKKIYRLNKKFWEELIIYFPLIPRGPHRKWHLQQFFVAMGMSLLSYCLAMIGGYIDRSTRHVRPTIPLLLHVFNATGTCLPSHCLAMKRGIHFTEPLPSNDKGLHIQTHRLMGAIYEVHHSDGLRCHDIHTKSHKDWFRHSKVNRQDSQTHREHVNSHKLTLIFFKMTVG